jgi:hypothetical protein
MSRAQDVAAKTSRAIATVRQRRSGGDSLGVRVHAPDDSVMRIEELAHQTRLATNRVGTVLLRSGADARLKADFADELKRMRPEAHAAV